MSSHAYPAPAKLNLFLHVVGRRADGYHLLQSVFRLINHGDTVHLELRDDDRIVREGDLPGVSEDDDLTVRAARLLQAYAPAGVGVSIRLDKNLPMGGGLGGGSSDAATVLLALNRLWRCGRSVDELASLGLPLGADVPVFIRGSSAWAEGVGERLKAVELPERWYVIIHPGVAVPTRDVFQSPELTRNSPVLTIHAVLESTGMMAGTRNDCEPVVRARYPEVADALSWLGNFASARLTGTGACIFASFATAMEAERVAARVPGRWRAFVAQGLNVSPVYARLRTAD